jgi:hypothetical protein
MLTFWLVTGFDDHRWEIIEREDETRFHRKEGRVLWLAGLPPAVSEDHLTPGSIISSHSSSMHPVPPSSDHD